MMMAVAAILLTSTMTPAFPSASAFGDRATVAAGCDAIVSFINGSDNPGAGSASAPFKTVAYALRRQGSAGIVCLRSDGVHRLATKIQIGQIPRGRGGLTLNAYPPDLAAGLGRPILSGAIPIGPFKPSAPSGKRSGSEVMTAAAPPGSSRPSVMFRPGGGWLQRARSPRTNPGPASQRARGFDDASTFHWAKPLVVPPGAPKGPWPDIDKMGFVFNRSDAGQIHPGLHAAAEIEVLHFHAWTAFWSGLAAIDAANSTLLFSEPSSAAIGQYAVQGGRRFILENIREGLDEPGEWYWDSATGTVSLVLPEDAASGGAASGPASEMVVMAPQLIQLLSFYGSADVTVRDLEFRHAGCGKRVRQYFPPAQDAAILIENSTRITFERVSVSDSGSHGWSLLSNVSSIAIVNSSATDLGGDGISVPLGTLTQHVLISNCLVNNTALVFLGQPAGITLKGIRNITVEHSTVSFVPYAGIKVGWQSVGDTDAAHGAIGVADPIFLVENNVVSDFGLGVLSDFGGVYISSDDNLCFEKSPERCYLPARVHGNVIAGCSYYNYGCNGVYMDEQVSGVDITHNVIYDIEDAGVYFHCGNGNRADNNVFAFCGAGNPAHDAVLGGCNPGGNPTWPVLPHGFNFTRNVVYLAGNERLIGVYAPDFRATVFDDNVYWSPNATLLSGLVFPNRTGWVGWRAAGHDLHSIEADPIFADVRNRDFRLRAGSPALGLGIEQPDQAGAGRHATPLPARHSIN